jgi:hypothetical protein
MDSITLDEFKSVFGNSLLDLSKGQEKQTSILTNIQNVIDQKIDKAIEHLEKLNDIANSFTGSKKTNASEPEVKPKSIPSRIAGALSSVLSPSRSPYARDTVNIEFTDKAKVILQDILDVKIEALYDRFTPHLEDISETLKAILENTIRPKEKPKGLMEYLKEFLGPMLGALLPLLLGAGAAIGGIAALFSGLTDSGPLKGLKKILAKGGLSYAFNIIKKGAERLTNAFKLVAKTLFGEKKINAFSEAAQGVMKKLVRRVGALRTLFFKKIEDSLFKIPKMVISYVKNFFGTGAKAITEITGKGLALKGGKGILNTILKGIGKFFSSNVLKRIPIIGSIIGLSFAVSRFKKGDIVGGIIDVASALATMVPGIGTALSIGLDVLNAFLDVKTGGSDVKAGAKKMDIFKDIFKKVGDAIMSVLQSIVAGFVDLLPEEAFGVKVRSRVSNLLKGSGFDVDIIKAQQKKEAEIAAANERNKPPNTSADTTDNITSAPETTVSTTSIQPKAPPAPITVSDTTYTDTVEGIDDMHGSIKEQNNFMRQLLTFSQQTAENTNNLILKFEENIGGKNIQINNVSNPTTFLATPASSSNFRAAAFGR